MNWVNSNVSFTDLQQGDVVMHFATGKLFVIDENVHIFDGEAYTVFEVNPDGVATAHVSEYADGTYWFVARPQRVKVK